jgi:uncharacterized membrane protein
MEKRLKTLDTLRGFTIISMILYHFCWDLKFIKGFDMEWYVSEGAHFWQQSICWSFILLAGFCMHFARSPLRNGAVVFLFGVIVTCVTEIFLPEAPIHFGVLTLLGSSMLLMGAYLKIYDRISGITHAQSRDQKYKPDKNVSTFGFLITAFLFALTKGINFGVLKLAFINIKLPESLYQNGGADGMGHSYLTYLGFMQNGFYSSDYFSLMPWFFLFIAGYFLYGVLRTRFKSKVFHIDIKPLSWLGRHSLIIYLLHQPVLYGITILLP